MYLADFKALKSLRFASAWHCWSYINPPDRKHRFNKCRVKTSCAVQSVTTYLKRLSVLLKIQKTHACDLHRMSANSYRNQQTAAMMRAAVPKMINADIMTVTQTHREERWRSVRPHRHRHTREREKPTERNVGHPRTCHFMRVQKKQDKIKQNPIPQQFSAMLY